MATIEERLQGAPRRLIVLAACAFARTVEHLLTDERSRDAIETAERFADKLATIEGTRAAAFGAEWAVAEAAGEAAVARAAEATIWAAAATETTTAAAWAAAAACAAEQAEQAEQAEAEATHQSILDCILLPRIQAHFPAHVKGLATTIYDNRDWKLMPILADALEEIGAS